MAYVSKLFDKVWDTVGHRGAVLLLIGIVDVAIGLSLFTASMTLQNTQYRQMESLLPLWLWGGVWIGVAVVCLIGAFSRADTIAYFCAVAIKLIWGFQYLYGWLFHGFERGWVSTAVWWMFGALMAVIASWPEVKHRLGSTSVDDAVITASKDGRIIFMNDVALEVFGVRAEEVVGEQLDSLMRRCAERDK